jgi:pre-mRNA branch site protein p14
MALQQKSTKNIRLAPEVNRALFVRNLPFKITSEEMYDLFGKYGAIRYVSYLVFLWRLTGSTLTRKRQIRMGTAGDTKGTAFVVYEDIFDAKNACEVSSSANN